LLDETLAPGVTGGRFVPHVVAWNLTRRCNLECAHCYISAGPEETATGELSTDECFRITEEILAINPAAMFLLSGGEPPLRAPAPPRVHHPDHGDQGQPVRARPTGRVGGRTGGGVVQRLLPGTHRSRCPALGFDRGGV